ncbi:MAG: orange carotenoid protein N-terminal domain-containing protein [Cyanobacteria bacterium J06623_7]
MVKLGFWYKLGKLMEQGVVAPIPEGYTPSANAKALLTTLQGLDSGQQITVLRNTVVDMGFDTDKMGKFESVSEPVAPPTEMSKRTKVNIEGVTNSTVLNYMNLLNANDFEELTSYLPKMVRYSLPSKTIVGKDAVFRFFKEECPNLKFAPTRGVEEPIEDGYTQVKVTGKVQTPWFGAGVGMNMFWRFLLNSENQIFFVAIDLLASPKELLKLAR